MTLRIIFHSPYECEKSKIQVPCHCAFQIKALCRVDAGDEFAGRQAFPCVKWPLPRYLNKLVKPILRTNQLVIKNAVRDIQLFPNEICGIRGLDGVGKSLFLKTLAGIKKTEAAIFFQENQLTKLKQFRTQGIFYFSESIPWLEDFSLFKNLQLFSNRKFKPKEIKELEVKLQNFLSEDVDLRVKSSLYAKADRLLILMCFLALTEQIKILLVDELEFFHSPSEVAKLYRIFDLVQKQSGSVLFILPSYLDQIPKLQKIFILHHQGTELRHIQTDESTHSLRVEFSRSPVQSDPIFPPKRKQNFEKLAVGMWNQSEIELRKSEILGLFRASESLSNFDIYLRLKNLIRGQDKRVYFVTGHRKKYALFENLSPDLNLGFPSLLRNKKANMRRLRASLWKHYSQVLRISSGYHIYRMSRLDQLKILLGRFLPMQPEVLILEEFSRGLSEVQRREIYQIIREIADAGVSIVWMSRELDELRLLCDRVGLAHENKILSFSSEISAADLIHQIQSLRLGGEK